MNLFFVSAGIIGVLGGLAHSFLGHQWTVKAIDPDTLKSTQNTPLQDQRFLVWFWHVGSLVLLSTSALLLLTGMAWLNLHAHLLKFISFLWLGISLLFFIIAGKKPNQIFRMIPGLIGIPVNILILLGLFYG